MKKICLFLSVFAFLTFVFPGRVFGFFEEIFEETTAEDSPIIFSDPDYFRPTHNFSSGQTVYIRVESAIGGEKLKILRLLDSEKKEVKKINLNQAGTVFTASFSVPNTPGIYYVDIKIEDSSGSKFASQENINVGKTEGTSVEAVAEAKAEVGVSDTEEISPTISVITPTPASVDKKPGSVSFIFQIIEFFREIFSQLTNWFK